jgi:heme/copper-type cytochrome/quinol oxidase subunit 2
VLLFYFVYKYRENKEFTRKKVANESKFEMLWISFAILLSIILIVASTPILLNIQEPSDTAGAVEIKVKAQRFSWSVEIPENNVSLKTLASIDGQTLNLTVNQLYMLNLTASENDVIHSFFSYDLSFKIDAVPGHFNIRYFKITDPGTYIVTCAEFCGVNHYTMQFKIVATL